MKVKVKDIAKAAGVSPSTVSLVLNNRPSRISEETKANIIRVAREMRFQQEMGTDFSGVKKTKVFGMIVPDGMNPFFQRLAEEISRYAYEEGYVVYQCGIGDNLQYFHMALESLIARNVEGLIVIPPRTMNRENVKILKSFQKSGPPIVLLDRAAYTVFCDFVTADNKFGGKIATEYLIAHGHTKIGCMMGEENIYTSRKRVNGYREALSNAGISYDNELVYYGNYDIASGYRGAKELLNKEVTAIVAGNDLMAYGVCLYAQEHNIAIPDDLSIVGYDNTMLCDMMKIPLTSIEQNCDMMASKAVEVLTERLEALEKKESAPYRNYYFTPHIVERGTVADHVNEKDR